MQAKIPRKVSTLPTKQDKAPTEQQVAVKPETVAEVAKPTPQLQGCDAYRNLISQYSWNVTTAVAICKAESGGDTNALSETCDRGLFQINCVHADMVTSLDDLYNPTTNISVAWRIYSANGWSAWSTFNSGAYLRYE